MSPTVTPNAGRITTSSGPRRVGSLTRVGEEADAGRAQPIVHVRVVDDLAGQEDVAPGEPPARLVGVVDGAVDAVAEAELAREVDGQAAGFELIVVGADVVDDRAVVGGGQLAGDGLLHVEALAEDQRL